MNNRRVLRTIFAAFTLTLIFAGSLQAQSVGEGDGPESLDSEASFDDVPVPALDRRVTDLTGTLSGSEVAQLDARLRAYEEKHGSQLVVLIVSTTGLEAIEQYAIRVAEAWQIGRAGVDDGIILLVAKNDRRVRIEVGYGLEGALPDAMAKRIISDYIVPAFREGEFYRGVSDGLGAIQTIISEEPLPEPEAQTRSGGGQAVGGAFQMIVFFGAFVIGGILRAFRFATRLVIGGGLAFIIFGLALVLSLAISSALFYGVVAFAISVLGIMPGGRGGGFSSGGFSSGGGGFSGGGFSGGGGSFGGGGASGSW